VGFFCIFWHHLQHKRNSFANSDDVLAILGKNLMEVEVDKASINWTLEAIELAAKRSVERLSDSDDETDEESGNA
jgi:hypothetical protein